MLQILPPPSPRWLAFQEAFRLYGVYLCALFAAHFIMGENPDAWPGDDWRAVGKAYMAAATTWVIWRVRHRSLDRSPQK